MSRACWIRCATHDTQTLADVNRGDQELAAAIRTAPIVRALRDTGAWDVSELRLECWAPGDFAWLARDNFTIGGLLRSTEGIYADVELPCDAFEVVDEYGAWTRVKPWVRVVLEVRPPAELEGDGATGSSR